MAAAGACYNFGAKKMKSAPEIIIPNIEAELNKSPAEGSGTSPLKASLFNLIVYSEGSTRQSHMHKMIEHFVTRFPCRILHITSHLDSAAEYLKVSVLTELVGSSDAPIYCDQVIVETTPDQMHRVPYLLLPNLVPDLPLFLLWGKNPLEEEVVFPFFEKLAERLVFESDASHNLRQFSEQVLERTKKSKLQWVDVTWGKTASWRNIFAETFDCEEKLKTLQNADSISITYSISKHPHLHHPEHKALYFQAWVASRLKWKPLDAKSDKDGTIKLYYDSGIKKAAIALRPAHSADVEPGRILAVEVSADDGREVLFKTCGENASKVVVHVSSPESCELPFNFTMPSGKKRGALIQELFFEPPTKQWKEVLQMLTHTPWSA